MSPVTATYRHSQFTAAPEGLSLAEIWAVATSLRRQLVPDSLERRVPLRDIGEHLSRLEINGVAFDVDWDLDHRVANRAGQQVMGVTEYDKASPDCVLVSVNGPMLQGSDTLLRSTIAHEIGHLVFDAPGWILIPPDAPVRSEFDGMKNRRDPREVRANELMGALLVPPWLLRVDWHRQAKRQRFPAAEHPSTVISGAPAYDGASLDGDAVEEAIFTLAERYGVSQSFIQVRLERYDLLRGGRSWLGL